MSVIIICLLFLTSSPATFLAILSFNTFLLLRRHSIIMPFRTCRLLSVVIGKNTRKKISVAREKLNVKITSKR
jgi:hypothetical protein